MAAAVGGMAAQETQRSTRDAEDVCKVDETGGAPKKKTRLEHQTTQEDASMAFPEVRRSDASGSCG